MFLFLLLMRNVLTTCVLICPIKCVSLYYVFCLYIHVFHAFGIFNVFVLLFICVVMISFFAFFLHFRWYLYICIHVICKHILLVWFSSFPSFKPIFRSIISFHYLFHRLQKIPSQNQLHISRFPMCENIQVPSRNPTHGFRPMWCRFQVLPEFLGCNGMMNRSLKNERTIWGLPFLVLCVFF